MIEPDLRPEFMDLTPSQQRAYDNAIDSIEALRRSLATTGIPIGTDTDQLIANLVIVTGDDSTVMTLYLLLREMMEYNARELVGLVRSRPIWVDIAF